MSIRDVTPEQLAAIKADACVVDGCGWYGTAYGSPMPRCRAQGGPRLCAFEYLEDREAYDDRTTTYRQWAEQKAAT